MSKEIMMRTMRVLIVAIPGLVLLGTPTLAWNAPKDAGAELFQPSDRCMACHNGLVGPDGEDVSIGVDWRPTMMGNAARDPYWHGAVRREITDHPLAQAAIEAECSKCHMPLSATTAHAAGGEGTILANLPGGGAAPATALLAQDGVSCTICHQITPEGLGEESSFVGGFVVDHDTAWGEREIYGPYDVDAGRTRVMQSASWFAPEEADQLRSAELCATCHTLITHSLGPGGEVVGELPEQVPYQEWQHSVYSGVQTCQNCHMKSLDEPVAISSTVGQPRELVAPHSFRGGNFFMPQALNANRATQVPIALPQEFDTAVARTTEHLQDEAATLLLDAHDVVDGQLVAEITVQNKAGHKLPTAYPSRRVWLHVTVRSGYDVVFESGALQTDGSISGNDNDADATAFEPHYATIEQPDQVQIYEAILGGPDGAVTTGLLTATDYLKDNRVNPVGFDKTTAGEWIAVHGGALDDEDFSGGSDRVEYVIDVGVREGPFVVEAELWYQPVGYRWAHNFGDVDAVETNRFVRIYEELSDASGVMLTSASATAERAVAEPELDEALEDVTGENAP